MRPGYAIDLLGLPSSILDSLDLLRTQWCNEPTVLGGKSEVRINARTAPGRTARSLSLRVMAKPFRIYGFRSAVRVSTPERSHGTSMTTDTKRTIRRDPGLRRA